MTKILNYKLAQKGSIPRHLRRYKKGIPAKYLAHLGRGSLINKTIKLIQTILPHQHSID